MEKYIEKYIEMLEAKRNPINSCIDLSQKMIGKRNGIFYFTEGFRMEFENKMYELSRLREKNKELEKENLMLKNTKNNCPLAITSGINCNIKTDCISKDKIREKLEELKTLPIVVGGRRIGKTLEYGIRLGKKQILEELLEE